ncbi:GNAT family N-acetyltransferase [Sphingomonas sp. PAMC26645]|uniref:GNAT family N-acetyltransferase n=1 Tax=Sphingomonas sp. PAMC26645 TaxID=2565555 RepID=UPI00109DCAF6|nr:GNAT family N-acetyltransferase [Sphingomonas sp. PAMC26645]QCB42929.1 GNAT family N-acetyltransferase [Sphingomonas sp. PAMC26645]
MTWRMRRAGPGDAPVLSLVASATFLDTYATVLTGADIVAHCTRNNSIAAFDTWLSDPLTIVTLAEYEPGHAPTGYTVLTAPDFPIEPGPADIELRRIYLMKQAQGSGLGAALMARAFEEAAAAGRTRVLLGVWDQNTRARAFYERQGFKVIGSRQFTVGTTLHDDPVYARAV